MYMAEPYTTYPYQEHPNSIENRLLKAYGTTTRIECAVWMLLDGTLVNGSYEGFQRDVDHHEISQFYKPSTLEKQSSMIYVQKFMRRGNIRVGCSKSGYCFQMAIPPSMGQFKNLIQAAKEAAEQNIEACFSRYSPVAGQYVWEEYETWLYGYIFKYMPHKYY